MIVQKIFAKLYVNEQGLPSYYQAIVAGLIREQIIEAMCKTAIYQQEAIKANQIFTQVKTKAPEKFIADFPEEWNCPEPFFTARLVDQLGNIGKFKFAEEKTKGIIPLILKNSLKSKALATIVVDTKSSNDSIQSGNKAVVEVEQQKEKQISGNKIHLKNGFCKPNNNTNLCIIYNKITQKAKIMSLNEVGKIKNHNKKRIKHKKKHKKASSIKKIDDIKPASQIITAVETSPQNNIIKLDMRSLMAMKQNGHSLV